MLSSALAAILLAAGSPLLAAPRGAAGEPEEPAMPELARRLREIEAGRRPSGEAWMLVECRTDRGFQTVEVFGRGVGFWDGRVQFTLEPQTVRELLAAFREASFAELEPVYGGPDDPESERPTSIQEPQALLRVTCHAELRIGGVDKEVTQLARGRQSPALARLARQVLELCEPLARNGVTFADLQGALEALRRGELAPEALHLLLLRKPERPGATTDEGEWILRVDGLRATLETAGASGYGEPVVRDLPAGLEVELAAWLAAAEVGSLPVNLFAPQYTDLSVEVLGHRSEIQARRFAGMTATSHGEAQARFDRLIEALETLRERLEASGRTLEEAGTPTP